MNINPMNFLVNTKYMVSGMLTILVVIGIIIVITTLLNKITSKLSK